MKRSFKDIDTQMASAVQKARQNPRWIAWLFGSPRIAPMVKAMKSLDIELEIPLGIVIRDILNNLGQRIHIRREAAALYPVAD